MPSVDDYVLGTDEVESVRLGIQHRLWSAQAASIWERAGIGPGARVLDVGCGPGHAAADLAQLVGPGGRVVGGEGSPAYVRQFGDRMARLGHAHAEVRSGDIHDLAAIAGDDAGLFDAAYLRWVCSFSQDLPRLIGQVAACLKPGGRVAIQDYFGWRHMTLAPRRAAFTRGIEATYAYWRGHGDNDVMGGMPRVLREAGLAVREFTVVQRLARPGEPLWAWPDSFWPSVIPRVVAAGFLTEAESRAFFEAWREASGDPDGFMVVPPVYEAIGVKAG